jgi:hypothetical protein
MNIKYALHKVVSKHDKEFEIYASPFISKSKSVFKMKKLKLHQNVRSDVLMVVWDYDHSQN